MDNAPQAEQMEDIMWDAISALKTAGNDMHMSVNLHPKTIEQWRRLIAYASFASLDVWVSREHISGNTFATRVRLPGPLDSINCIVVFDPHSTRRR